MNQCTIYTYLETTGPLLQADHNQQLACLLAVVPIQQVDYREEILEIVFQAEVHAKMLPRPCMVTEPTGEI